jgi:hypothetical protein
MGVVLPSRNVDKFKSYFLSHNSEENESKKVYFRRTFLDDIDEDKNEHGMSCLHISCECAWSVASCIVDGNPEKNDDGTRCPPLKEVCKDCEVSRLTIYSVEPGVGFEESVTFNKDEGEDIQYSSRDTYPDPWNEFVDQDEEDVVKETEMN